MANANQNGEAPVASTDDPKAQDENAANGDAQQVTEDQEKASQKEVEGSTTEDGNSLEELPQWSQDYISRLRKDQARYRTERNELSDKLKAIQESGDADEQKRLIAELQEDNEKKSLLLSRVQVARDHGLPQGYDVLLTGNDEETLTKQAKVLADLATARATANNPLAAATNQFATPPQNPRSIDTPQDLSVEEKLELARKRRARF